eukprot:6181984-Pleurochrysis_carterae.AAC.5
MAEAVGGEEAAQMVLAAPIRDESSSDSHDFLKPIICKLCEAYALYQEMAEAQSFRRKWVCVWGAACARACEHTECKHTAAPPIAGDAIGMLRRLGADNIINLDKINPSASNFAVAWILAKYA